MRSVTFSDIRHHVFKGAGRTLQAGADGSDLVTHDASTSNNTVTPSTCLPGITDRTLHICLAAQLNIIILDTLSSYTTMSVLKNNYYLFRLSICDGSRYNLFSFNFPFCFNNINFFCASV